MNERKDRSETMEHLTVLEYWEYIKKKKENSDKYSECRENSKDSSGEKVSM